MSLLTVELLTLMNIDLLTPNLMVMKENPEEVMAKKRMMAMKMLKKIETGIKVLYHMMEIEIEIAKEKEKDNLREKENAEKEREEKMKEIRAAQ